MYKTPVTNNEPTIFSNTISKSRISSLCNDRNNPFHFACRKWYLYNNPQCLYGIITPIQT